MDASGVSPETRYFCPWRKITSVILDDITTWFFTTRPVLKSTSRHFRSASVFATTKLDTWTWILRNLVCRIVRLNWGKSANNCRADNSIKRIIRRVSSAHIDVRDTWTSFIKDVIRLMQRRSYLCKLCRNSLRLFRWWILRSPSAAPAHLPPCRPNIGGSRRIVPPTVGLVSNLWGRPGNT